MSSITSEKKSAWITWEHQRRNISMSNLTQSDYYEFNDIRSKVLRYPINIWNTAKIFFRPYSIIYVQNPSIVLSFVSVLLGKLSSKKIIIDAHNAGVFPLEGRYKLLQSFNLWILKNSNLVIVTNQKIKNHLENLSISCVVIPDPLPLIEPAPHKNHEKFSYDVLIICSWAEDEPIDEYLEVSQLIKEWTFAFTGNHTSYFKHKNKTELPENVYLLGFVSEQEYNLLLTNSKVIMDLTKREDCLVCGAYEAIAFNKSIILSDTEVNRELFGDAASYSHISSQQIKENLIKAMKSRNKMKEQIKRFKIEYQALQQENIDRLYLSIK